MFQQSLKWQTGKSWDIRYNAGGGECRQSAGSAAGVQNAAGAWDDANDPVAASCP